MHKVTIFAAALMPAMKIFTKKNRTSRVIIPVNVTGEKLTIRFSNRYGRNQGIIGQAMIAKCTKEGAMIVKTQQEITFQGEKVGSIPPGHELISDEIIMTVSPGEYLALSVYCPQKPETISGLGEYVVLAKQPGNCCLEYFEKDLQKEAHAIEKGQPPVYTMPFFHGVDVMTNEQPMIISVLGDSIAQQCKWTKPLQELLYDYMPGRVILLNQSIAGNQFTRDAYRLPIFGEAGNKRVQWDTFADYGVTHVLFCMGVNDIDLNMVPAKELYQEVLKLKKIVEDKDMSFIGLTPYPASLGKKKNRLEKEELRLDYHRLLLQDEETNIIDIEGVLKNSKQIGYKEGYGAGDGLHLNVCGGQVLAKKIMEHVESVQWL